MKVLNSIGIALLIVISFCAVIALGLYMAIHYIFIFLGVTILGIVARIAIGIYESLD